MFIHEDIQHNYIVVMHGHGGIEWGLKAIARQAKTPTEKSKFSKLMFTLIENEEINRKTIHNILAMNANCTDCPSRNGYCMNNCAYYRHSNTIQQNPSKNQFRYYLQHTEVG